LEKNLRYSRLLDFYKNLITKKQADFLELYYNEDLSLGEIAADEGLTRQGVYDAIKRGEKALLECEEKLGLCARFDKISQAVNTISDLISDGDESAGEIRKVIESIREDL